MNLATSLPFFKLSALAIALCCGTATAAQSEQSTQSKAAQTKAKGDTSFQIGEHIEVVGKGLTDASRVLTSVDRMSADVAQSSEADYAWKLLGRLPGVMLTEFNQGSSSGKLSFRGFNGEGEVNAVKLLIDGIPSNSNDGNMPYMDMIFPLEIEVAEVVRGTTDPRFGLYNIAGNVSFVTRSGGNYLDSRLSVGSFGKTQAQFAAGIEQGDLRQNYALSYRKADGYRDHSESTRYGFSGKWGWDMSDALTLNASARTYQADLEEPGYLTADLAYSNPRATNAYNRTDLDERAMDQFSLGLDAKLNEQTDLKTLVWMNQLDDDRFVKFSAATSQQNRVSKEQHYGASSTLGFSPQVALLQRLYLELGASVEVQDNESRRYLTTERVVTSQTRDQQFDLQVQGIYAQATMEPNDWLRITPSWRFDQVEGDFTDFRSGTDAPINDYGSISQPKLAVAVLATDELTLFSNWGRSFQIGAGSGAYLIPPRQVDLAPSINKGWELGLKYQGANDLQLRTTLWQQSASGEFKRKLNDPLGDFDNLGATERKGVDLQLGWTPLQQLSLWGAVAWQQAEIETPDPATPALAGKDIDHIPQWLYNAGLDYSLNQQLSFSAAVRAQSSYELTTSNHKGRFGDFLLLDLQVSYQLNEQTEFSAQIQNLTDQYYEYVWWDGSQTLHSPGESRALNLSVHLRY
jgi:iron complex outermembrane recepter protein